jgi:hypothetical protein
VRQVSIENDIGKQIFSGEIRQARGNCSYEDNFECIMFTKNEEIIKLIDSNDWLNEKQEPLESTIIV